MVSIEGDIMGRKSTKENKTFYQTSREALGLMGIFQEEI